MAGQEERSPLGANRIVLKLSRLTVTLFLATLLDIACTDALALPNDKSRTETAQQAVKALVMSGEMPNEDGLRISERQRLLDRLAALESDKKRRLDELEALQRSTTPTVDSQPLVKILGTSPPYSALRVDALRDELDGQLDRLRSLSSSLTARELEKQEIHVQFKRNAESVRLANDKVEMARGDIEVARAKWEQEVSALRQRVIEAELGIRDIEQQWVQVQISRLRVQHEALQQYVKKLLPLQRLSAEEIEQQRALMGGARTKLITEIDEAKAANAQRGSERESLLKESLSGGRPETDARLAYLGQALEIDRAVLDGLGSLEILLQLTTDSWENRYLALSSTDADQQRLAQATLAKLFDMLHNRKRFFSLDQREITRVEISEQETRITNLPMVGSEQQQAQELLDLLQQRAAIYDRGELAANRLERQLGRWLADLAEPQEQSFGALSQQFGSRVGQWLRTVWEFELFSVEDVSVVDGRKVPVSYGVTVGKSVGAVLLFVFGYWLVAKLVQLLQRVLVARFGIEQHMSSVIRRWVMIFLAVALAVLILNLARIPLTAFTFAGGALAIGVGFGAQNIIKNVISGIIILLERKVRVGDIIEQGGMTGHVTAIDLRATTVRGFDGIEALVPNSSLLETQVINWTYSNHQIRRELKIGVAYGSDTRAAELVLQNAAISHPKVLEVPAPEVFFEDFADSSLLMVLIFWVELGPGVAARRIGSDLRHDIYQRLAEAGIDIPFPQHEVHLVVDQPLPGMTVNTGGV